jgi:2-(1,2-epoxy-1,2-dihydrophenyl)acetyl-CoA isomerase
MTMSPSTLPAILFTVENGIAMITLNRPDKLNSFTRQMHAELRQAMDAVEKDSAIRCLVIQGAGRGFCAGQDLADLSFEPGNMTELGELIGNNFNPRPP